MSGKVVYQSQGARDPIGGKEIFTWAMFIFGLFLLVFGCPLVGMVVGAV